VRIDPERLLKHAARIARATATYALSQSSRRGDVARHLAHDVKLRLDIECQALAKKLIRAEFPRHRILGEEDKDSTTTPLPDFSFATEAGNMDADYSDILWIVDPLDGTVNFNHGIPLWCCSVAVAVRNQIVAGAVHIPLLNRCYAARAGGKATCNGKPINVSNRNRLPDSIVVTGMDRNLGPRVPPFAMFNSIAGKVQRARVLGSAAVDLCLVADGAADAYLEAGIYIWDIAAGGLIVQQAGGRLEQLARFPGNRLCFLASNGMIHKAIKTSVSPVLKAATKVGPGARQ